MGEHFVELRHEGRAAEGRRLGVHLSRLAQNVDEQVAHDGGGDVVEHDRRDDDVAVAIGLQIAGNGRESRAEQCRADDCRDGERVAGQEPEMKRDKRRAEAPDIGLPLGADVEQTGMETDRDPEPGEDEARRVEQGVADSFKVAERAKDEALDGLKRILADRQHDKTGDYEGGGDVDERKERDVRPGGQGLERRAHAARSLTPAIKRPRSCALVSSGRRSPVTRPPQSTMMRSESAKISSSSTETKSTALPASRWATIRLWMNSIAPMSTPRVGCPTSRIFGLRSISRASTIFCWLPPEKLAVLSKGARGLTSKDSIFFSASETMALRL